MGNQDAKRTQAGGHRYCLMSLLASERIEVPVFQREYAQGRASAAPVRARFLQYLLECLADDKAGGAVLDFVYGVPQGQGDAKTFVPVDGQQRLTTLFLLHWYLAWRLNKVEEVMAVLRRFCYETRPSSRDFLACLCDEEIKVPEGLVARPPDINDLIRGHMPWFDASWGGDASVRGMLEMLKDMEAAIKGMAKARQEADLNAFCARLWERLDSLQFYRWPLTGAGDAERIYIRMNERGEQLTPYEKFKAELCNILDNRAFLDDFGKALSDFGVEPGDDLAMSFRSWLETEFVHILWDFRLSAETRTTDVPFMSLLDFVVAFRDEKLPNPHKEKAERPEDRRLRVIGKARNLAFLCAVILRAVPALLRYLPAAGEEAPKSFWCENMASHVAEVLFRSKLAGGKQQLEGVSSQNGRLLYAALRYLVRKGAEGELEVERPTFENYLRMARNVIHNVDNLPSNVVQQVVKLLAEYASNGLSGFAASEVENPDAHFRNHAQADNWLEKMKQQWKEELLKAKLVCAGGIFSQERYERLCEMENHQHLKGRLMVLLEAFSKKQERWKAFETIAAAYECCERDGFKTLLGEIFRYVYVPEWRSEWRLVLKEDLFGDRLYHKKELIQLMEKAVWFSEKTRGKPLDAETLALYVKAKQKVFVRLRKGVADLQYPGWQEGNGGKMIQNQLYFYHLITNHLVEQDSALLPVSLLSKSIGLLRVASGGKLQTLFANASKEASPINDQQTGGYVFQQYNPSKFQSNYNRILKIHEQTELEKAPDALWSRLRQSLGLPPLKTP